MKLPPGITMHGTQYVARLTYKKRLLVHQCNNSAATVIAALIAGIKEVTALRLEELEASLQQAREDESLDALEQQEEQLRRANSVTRLSITDIAYQNPAE